MPTRYSIGVTSNMLLIPIDDAVLDVPSGMRFEHEAGRRQRLNHSNMIWHSR
jgi:hypothetical protein